jgi:5-methylcytosine-specific restriction protein A
MSRSVPEWVGVTADVWIPIRVRLRIWQKFDGRCALCARKLTPGDKFEFDHVQALINGGEHRESNLQLVCQWCHKEKSRADVAEKAKVAAVKARHLGLRKRKSRQWPCGKGTPYKRKVTGEVVDR